MTNSVNYFKGTSFLFSLLLLSGNLTRAQVVPQDRIVDWEFAGLRDTTTQDFIWVNMIDQGCDPTGNTNNDAVLDSLLSVHGTDGAVFFFPEGEYLFNQSIYLSSNQVLKGEGMDKTYLNFDLGGAGDAIRIDGSIDNSVEYALIEDAEKDQEEIRLDQSGSLSPGDWLKMYQEDDDLVTSSWALNTVGQICRIEEIQVDEIGLESSLRMNFELLRSPKSKKLNMISNVGVECLKIKRMDDAAPEQASNIAFHYSANCWVKNVESQNCTFAHIVAENSSNLSITRSYFHHGFDYGGGGRAYGVALQFTTNECLIEDNIFEHLRHSMLLQAGPNGNVFTYNFSTDPYWTSSSPFIPNDAAGDMVLHGNYPYANLFEQNSAQNIVIDNSHGPNGPHNTFFRNRASLFGIFFSDANSPSQNLIGNEIPNTTSPYSLVNYTIQGSDQFEYGNNNKGNITPAGTETLEDESYYYEDAPDFLNSSQWAGIGTPNVMVSALIPAEQRYIDNSIYDYPCQEEDPQVQIQDLIKAKAYVYPNPVREMLTVESELEGSMQLLDLFGKTKASCQIRKGLNHLSVQDLHPGTYSLVLFNKMNEKEEIHTIVLLP